MFKQFFELFRKDNMMQQAYDRSLEMLEADREMFLAASSSLREHDDARIELDIYAKDQLINAYEREVRRKVLTHLALSPRQSIAAATRPRDSFRNGHRCASTRQLYAVALSCS